MASGCTSFHSSSYSVCCERRAGGVSSPVAASGSGDAMLCRTELCRTEGGTASLASAPLASLPCLRGQRRGLGGFGDD